MYVFVIIGMLLLMVVIVAFMALIRVTDKQDGVVGDVENSIYIEPLHNFHPLHQKLKKKTHYN